MKDCERLPARKPGRPRTFSDEKRRQSILSAAHDAFIELGFARTTTAAIAARARISKRSIYEAFADKTELFAAVIRENKTLVLDLPRPADEELSLQETLIRIFRLDIDDATEQQREAMLNLLVRESILFPELADYLYENGIIRSREALTEWLEQEIHKGRLRAEDPQVLAGMLMDIVFGALLPRRRLREATDRKLRTEHIRQRLIILLRAVQAD